MGMRMASLIELRASDTGLTSLPESIGRLSRLRELHLRNNKLASLPESVGTLRELRQIDLRGNPLTNLPAALAALPQLKKLDLRWVTTLAPPRWWPNSKHAAAWFTTDTRSIESLLFQMVLQVRRDTTS
jgi:hypothetical protein